MTLPTPPADRLNQVIKRVTAIRHDLHQHPELGYAEHRTARVITEELTRLGIPFQTGFAGGTGVIAHIIGHASPGPCVALRADMDALPIPEATRAPYASQTPNCMHACGHDGHTAILLGAAALLQDAAAGFRGSVKLIFQPAEEGGCGAERLCQEGVLDNPKVAAIFGLHGWPGLKVGCVATKPGPLLASVDGFSLTITGRGSHAAAPQDGVDPIVCGAALVQALQTIVARETDPLDAAVLTVAQFQAGSNFNVLPETAVLQGTIRALTAARRASLIDSLERISRGVADAHRCQVKLEYYGTTPCTDNTPELAEFVRETAHEALGPGRYFPAARPAMWGEDFAFYLQRVPGCFFVLGLQPPERDSYPMLHNPTFDFNDAALPYGIRMMSGLALRFLQGRSA